MTAIKHDSGKPPCDLLPPMAMLAVSRVLGHGTVEYTRYNWLEDGGLQWSRLAAALLRHAFRWLAGQDTDPDSGLPHIAHVACCALMLCEYSERSCGIDDRFKAGP